MSIPSTAGITQALVDLLAAATARPVGDGTLPTAADPPFAVVYPLNAGLFWGPDYVAPQAASALSYQVTAVDVSRAGVEAFADSIRHALLDRNADGAFITPLVVAGLAVLDRELTAYGGVVFDRGAFNLADTYHIHVTLP